MGYLALVRATREVAPSGTYGQIFLARGRVDALYVIAAELWVLAVTGLLLLVLGWRRGLVIGAAVASAVVVVGLVATAGRPTPATFVAGDGCVSRPSFDELRASWADRPTVGEVLSFGLVDGHVLDDPDLLTVVEQDPDAAGCSSDY